MDGSEVSVLEPCWGRWAKCKCPGIAARAVCVRKWVEEATCSPLRDD